MQLSLFIAASHGEEVAQAPLLGTVMRRQQMDSCVPNMMCLFQTGNTCEFRPGECCPSNRFLNDHCCPVPLVDGQLDKECPAPQEEGDCIALTAGSMAPWDGYFASDSGEVENRYETTGNTNGWDGQLCKEATYAPGMYGTQDIEHRHTNFMFYAKTEPHVSAVGGGLIPGGLCLEVSEVVHSKVSTTNFWWGRIDYNNDPNDAWMLLGMQAEGHPGNTMVTEPNCVPQPTEEPSEEPTEEPSEEPTEEPAIEPTEEPEEQPNEVCSLNTEKNLCEASSSDCMWFKNEEICVLAEGCSIDQKNGKKCKNKQCCKRNGKENCVFDRDTRLCMDVALPENPCDHRGNNVPHSKTSCKNREGCKWNNQKSFCYDPNLESVQDEDRR